MSLGHQQIQNSERRQRHRREEEETGAKACVVNDGAGDDLIKEAERERTPARPDLDLLSNALVYSPTPRPMERINSRALLVFTMPGFSL
jgi:hypothetical protein